MIMFLELAHMVDAPCMLIVPISRLVWEHNPPPVLIIKAERQSYPYMNAILEWDHDGT